MPPPTIALLTDFGNEDWFVGTMKGVIRKIAPRTRVIDLCHHIPMQDVRAGAFVLDCAFLYFPEQTVFCCVVDPGVGTERSVICAKNGRNLFVAPDNGLLSFVAYRAGPMWKVWRAKDPRFFLPSVTATFQGRDVFAPLAAYLSTGVDLDDVGEPTEDFVTFPLCQPHVSADGEALEGEVLYIDRFGNLITNIQRQHLDNVPQDSINQKKWSIMIGDKSIVGLSHSFADKKQGQPLFYWGSADYLEIAINQGSACDVFKAYVGLPVMLYLY